MDFEPSRWVDTPWGAVNLKPSTMAHITGSEEGYLHAWEYVVDVNRDIRDIVRGPAGWRRRSLEGTLDITGRAMWAVTLAGDVLRATQFEDVFEHADTAALTAEWFHDSRKEDETLVLRELGSSDPWSELYELFRRAEERTEPWWHGSMESAFAAIQHALCRAASVIGPLSRLDPVRDGPTRPYRLLKAVWRLVRGARISVGDAALVWGVLRVSPGWDVATVLASWALGSFDMLEAGEEMGETLEEKG